MEMKGMVPKVTGMILALYCVLVCLMVWWAGQKKVATTKRKRRENQKDEENENDYHDNGDLTKNFDWRAWG